MELSDVKGIGQKRKQELNEKGIYNVHDLLNIFPNKYLDFSSVDEYSYDYTGEELTIKAKMVGEAKSVYFKGLNYVIASFMCVTSRRLFNAVWYGQPFMKNNLALNTFYYLIGKVNKKKQLVVTKYFEIDKIDDCIVPVYGSKLPFGKTSVIKIIKNILECENNISNIGDIEFLGLSLNKAYHEVHFPSSIEMLEIAKRRINIEDLILLAALEAEIKGVKKQTTRNMPKNIMADFKNLCPFKLTEDQNKVMEEILSDCTSNKVMNRLVIGDVGSGKTMVAFFAAFLAIKSGKNVIMISPTEILAKQHYNTFIEFFKDSKINAELLSSSVSGKEKQLIEQKAASGKLDFLIATHSALNDKIFMPNLGLVIADEQHRFGVSERAKLSNKGQNVDSLIMSATPIPRSLALVLFGGLSVSEIKSRPYGDSKIKTNIVNDDKESDMWKYIKNETQLNNSKCFVVCPRVEESCDENSVFAVGDIYDIITKKYGFCENDIAIIHGKMDKKEIEKAIKEFKCGNKNILISTTIIEVGIDVKAANLMVIYNAERFGLATLHQLRGRIGRDGRLGYCFLCPKHLTELSYKRLNLFKNNNNGLLLAEEDLKLRGAGTLYGTKQHGTNEIFLNINFSLEDYKMAKEIFIGLDEERKEKLKEKATKKFGDIYKKVVLN